MLNKIKPSVNKKYLIFLSGVIWTGVGIFLNSIALQWLIKFEPWQIGFTYSAGGVLGLLISWFGFRHLAAKNIVRISQYPDKVCIFAFQRWQMYILVAVMMSMGLIMRSTELIPKFILAPVYVGIGLALFLAAFVYHKEFWSLQYKTSKVSVKRD